MSLPAASGRDSIGGAHEVPHARFPGIRFDLAIFLLNDISYASNETSFWEEEVVARYGKPVIALYGKPDDDPAYPGRVLEAGATAVLRLPFKLLELQNALKRCIE